MCLIEIVINQHNQMIFVLHVVDDENGNHEKLKIVLKLHDKVVIVLIMVVANVVVLLIV